METTRHSLVIGQLANGAWRWAFFFFFFFFLEKFNFFQLEKTLWAAEKTPVVAF